MCAAAPEGELAGLRAVVTGSSSGIGAAIAREFATAGARVLVHARRNEDLAREVARECGDPAAHCLADVSTRTGRESLQEQALDHFGEVDVWVNNAGADVITGENAGLSFEEKLELLWRTDVESTIHLSRSIGMFMSEAGSGCIINVGWDQATTGMEGDSGEYFAATKGAILSFTRSLALSLAPRVRVNALAPGWIRTAWGEAAADSWQERVLSETPLKRWGRPEDVAHAARHLASPRSSYITGQVIAVNGGAVR